MGGPTTIWERSSANYEVRRKTQDTFAEVWQVLRQNEPENKC